RLPVRRHDGRGNAAWIADRDPDAAFLAAKPCVSILFIHVTVAGRINDARNSLARFLFIKE
ncbi:hypothetical protein, partial [Raoultella planticola]|uniref:hypothetical protein n=1 Tax=Raoultella planticola TaxID=575 RepID=UPI003524D514